MLTRLRGHLTASCSPALLVLTAVAGPTMPLRAAEPMEKAVIIVERNATDDDLEVRIDVSSGADGFASLQITAPDGRQVLDLRSRDTNLGVRQVTLESPEPVGSTSVLADLPAGTYRFNGKTTSGAELTADASLIHTMPAAPTIVSPEPDRRDVPVNGVELRWTRVPDVAGYLLVVEHERSGQELRAQLPASVTSLAIPSGFLTGGRTYKVAVGAFVLGGNRTFVEAEFSTAK